MTKTWEIHEFKPNNDGYRVGHVLADHTAWLKRSDNKFISLNIASVGLPEGEAKGILEAMVAALNLTATQESDQRTPAARWRAEGKADPHGDRYACERHETAGGQYSDDEVANGVFMDPSIEWLTIAKDRIRWLSRRLFLAEKALKPFAEYGDSNQKFPRGGQISHGSSMAKRQLTMGDCYDAAAALKGIDHGG